jgi:hypothetical protein
MMGIKSEKIEGKKIICEIDSSNLSKAIYDTKEKTLTVTFKSGIEYEYYKVPHQIFTKLRMAESQGRFFNLEISKKYKFKRLTVL